MAAVPRALPVSPRRFVQGAGLAESGR